MCDAHVTAHMETRHVRQYDMEQPFEPNFGPSTKSVLSTVPPLRVIHTDMHLLTNITAQCPSCIDI